jgi:hypothetical protein
MADIAKCEKCDGTRLLIRGFMIDDYDKDIEIIECFYCSGNPVPVKRAKTHGLETASTNPHIQRDCGSETKRA